MVSQPRLRSIYLGLLSVIQAFGSAWGQILEGIECPMVEKSPPIRHKYMEATI